MNVNINKLPFGNESIGTIELTPSDSADIDATLASKRAVLETKAELIHTDGRTFDELSDREKQDVVNMGREQVSSLGNEASDMINLVCQELNKSIVQYGFANENIVEVILGNKHSAMQLDSHIKILSSPELNKLIDELTTLPEDAFDPNSEFSIPSRISALNVNESDSIADVLTKIDNVGAITASSYDALKDINIFRERTIDLLTYAKGKLADITKDDLSSQTISSVVDIYSPELDKLLQYCKLLTTSIYSTIENCTEEVISLNDDPNTYSGDLTELKTSYDALCTIVESEYMCNKVIATESFLTQFYQV